MKILQLCHKPPFPAVDGGCIAMNNITQGLLRQGIHVKVLALNTFKHPLNTDALPDDYAKQTGIETVFADTRIKIIDAFVNLFSDESYNVKRFYSKEFEKKIKETLQKSDYDIIHLESIFVTPYLDVIRDNSGAKIILRAHNIEFEIWEEMAKGEKNFFKKKYLHFLAERMKNYELNLLNIYDGIATISGEDEKKIHNYGCKILIENIPFGINVSEYDIDSQPISLRSGASAISRRGEGSHLFFLGSMDWLPNREGLEWFFAHVWTEVSRKHPQLKLTLAGRGMTGSFLKMNINNVEVHGEIPDAKKFMMQNSIMLVPLLSGSGIRVKIVEALALGKTVITTSVGAKGIGAEHRKNILIADTPADFAEMIHLAVTETELRKNISENAIQFVKKNYDNRIITKKLISFYKQILMVSS